MWRALADGGDTSVPGFQDAVAVQMLGIGFRAALRLTQRWLRRQPVVERARNIERFDPIAIRVAAIDRELLAAVRGGCAQVVILGAGLDTRAYRFDELARATIFEVDHPATQAEKRRRAARLVARSRQIFVPVDFTVDSLDERLATAGHDAGAPTVWIWEGVVDSCHGWVSRPSVCDRPQPRGPWWSKRAWSWSAMTAS